MKTIEKTEANVIKANPQYKAIIKAVVSQLGGIEQMEDIRNHGMNAGFPGFIYYRDTHGFAMKHRAKIVLMLEDMADQLGEEVVQMVSGFGVFRGSPMDNEDRKELYKYLGGGRCEQSTITNVMAWFAAEEVARMFED